MMGQYRQQVEKNACFPFSCEVTEAMSGHQLFILNHLLLPSVLHQLLD